MPCVCSAGCLNGGGQAKPAPGLTSTQLLDQLDVRYAGAEGSGGGGQIGSSPEVERLYREWVGGEPGSAAARRVLHTVYHRREKTVTASLADW